MTVAHRSPDHLDEHLKRIRAGLVGVIEQAGNDHLRECWPRWEHLLDDLEEQARQEADFSISLVGSTGSGKTTLINALLGMDLLPTREGHPCTSAVCEIGHSPEGRFHAEVTFVKPEEWAREVERLRGDLGATSPGAEDSREDRQVTSAIREATLQKIRAVYRLDKDVGEDWFVQNQPALPQAVSRALEVGTESFSCAPDEEETFADQIQTFLASDQPFWPIVRAMRIRGPFPALRGGVKLVDLPGVNDPSEAREQVMRRHLKECKLVWLVFSIKRALTRDVVELMQSEDFFRQMIMDGRTDRLAFIGTHSDNINIKEASKQYGLDKKAPLQTILDRRKEYLRETVTDILTQLTRRLAERGNAEEQTVQSALARLAKFDLFSVSARDYLAFTQDDGTRTQLDTPEQTELPALIEHVAGLARDYGYEHRARTIQQELGTLIREIGRELQAQQVRLEQQSEMTVKQREEVQGAATAALSFLDGRLSDYRERYRQDLRNKRDLLMERFKLGKERGCRGIEGTLGRWGDMHFATLGATCRHGGRFTGTAGAYDLPGQLAEPLLDSIAFTWADFFGDQLNQVMEWWYRQLLELAREHARKFTEIVRKHSGSGSRVSRETEQLQTTTEKVLHEQLAQSRKHLQSRIDETRASLYERVPDKIRDYMQAAFAKAGKETGKGMKRRMVEDHLRPAALEVGRVVFQDAEQEIDAELRGLQDTLERSYGEVADTVRRHADTDAQNFWLDAHELSLEGIERERQQLHGAAEALLRISGGTGMQ
jgi:energy-coupling factor transporter ATP-binding protein EcfA2